MRGLGWAATAIGSETTMRVRHKPTPRRGVQVGMRAAATHARRKDMPRGSSFAGQPVGADLIGRGGRRSRADPAELLVQPAAAHGADTVAMVAVASQDQGAGGFHRNRPHHGAIRSQGGVAEACRCWPVHFAGRLHSHCELKCRQYVLKIWYRNDKARVRKTILITGSLERLVNYFDISGRI